jgi:hypothetical protein
MAKCDEGYLCRICSEEVEQIVDSDLYLQYVVGWIDPETLHTSPECHLRCNPTVAQFIDDPRFHPPVVCHGDFAKQNLDVDFVAERTDLINRGYARLWELIKLKNRPAVNGYPLPEAIDKWSG